MKKMLFAAGAVLAGLIGAFVLTEAALRLLGAQTPISLVTLRPSSTLEDRETDWDRTYRINSDGVRDDEHARAKPAGTIRVALVGDSYTFGQGCERGEIFPDLLAASMKSRSTPVEVLNFGNVALETEDYYVMTRDLAMKYAPDVVVVNVSGNDASQLVRSRRLNRAVRTLSHSLRSFVLVRDIRMKMSIRSTRDFWGTLAGLARNDDVRRTLDDFRREHGDASNNAIAAFVNDPDDVVRTVDTVETGAGWEDFQLYIGKIAALCREKGCTLVLGIVPDGALVDPAQLAFRRAFGVPMGDEYLTKAGGFQTLIKGLAGRLGVPVYDPLPAFRAARTGLFFEHDMHWTPAGHRLYAEGLEAFLVQQGAIPAAPSTQPAIAPAPRP